jgi:hypothetical protein
LLKSVWGKKNMVLLMMVLATAQLFGACASPYSSRVVATDSVELYPHSRYCVGDYDFEIHRVFLQAGEKCWVSITSDSPISLEGSGDVFKGGIEAHFWSFAEEESGNWLWQTPVSFSMNRVDDTWKAEAVFSAPSSAFYGLGIFNDSGTRSWCQYTVSTK